MWLIGAGRCRDELAVVHSPELALTEAVQQDHRLAWDEAKLPASRQAAKDRFVRRQRGRAGAGGAGAGVAAGAALRGAACRHRHADRPRQDAGEVLEGMGSGGEGGDGEEAGARRREDLA